MAGEPAQPQHPAPDTDGQPKRAGLERGDARLTQQLGKLDFPGKHRARGDDSAGGIAGQAALPGKLTEVERSHGRGGEIVALEPGLQFGGCPPAGRETFLHGEMSKQSDAHGKRISLRTLLAETRLISTQALGAGHGCLSDQYPKTGYAAVVGRRLREP